MGSKHTPGPWIVKHSETKNAFNVVGTALGYNYKIARCPYIVYDFPGADQRNVKEKNEGEANAKLIAAAPDLLDALKSLLKDYEESDFDIVSKSEELIANAKAAIQKATK